MIIPRMRYRIRLTTLLLLGGCLLAPGLARAAEAGALDYDRFDLRFGGGWVFGADTTVSLIGARGVGTTIDYKNTLDGDTSNATYRFDGTWRWNKKNSLTYSYYDVNRTGSRVIDQDINFGDQTYSVGAKVDSQLDIRLHRLLYRYSLVSNDQIHFDAGGGFYYGKINMTATADGFAGPNSGIATNSVTIQAPMPTVGVNMECMLSQRFGAFFSADWFYFAYNDWEGAQTDIMVGATYKIARNWTLGAGFDRFAIDLQGPVQNSATFKIANAWNSLFSYLSFHF
jgi:hypothetical protein